LADTAARSFASLEDDRGGEIAYFVIKNERFCLSFFHSASLPREGDHTECGGRSYLRINKFIFV
jgi:hypothetical protein